MKKIISVLLIAVMVAAAFGMTSCGKFQSKLAGKLEGDYTNDLSDVTLKVYNWGEYISVGEDDTLDVNREFEEATGIKVEYTTYDNNEVMYSKLKSGAVAYDIVIPSDYMIERMISEDMLQKIDTSKLSNYKYIDEKYKGVFYDPDNEYSVPYNVGMVGLIYNTTMVEGDPTSWSVMWDEAYKGKILNFGNPRDSFAIAQFLLGIDLNTTDTAEWDRAADKLIEQNEVLQGRVNDDVFDKMEQGNAAIAAYYAGDYLTMADVNEDLAFVYPEEGVNIFIDAICIPKTSKNYDAAMLYINFLMEPEVALANAEYLCYASPNTAVVNNPDYSLAGNEYLYPAEEDMPKTEYFHDLPKDVRDHYEDLWTKVKMGG